MPNSLLSEKQQKQGFSWADDKAHRKTIKLSRCSLRKKEGSALSSSHMKSVQCTNGLIPWSPGLAQVRAMIDSHTFQNIPQHSAAISELMCNVHLALLALYGQMLEGGWKNEAAVGSE